MKNLLLALACLVLVRGAQAGIILDQRHPISGSVVLNDNLEWQQQVTAGRGGVLAGIDLFVSPNGFFTVSIGLGSAFFNGPFAFTISTDLFGPDGVFIDTSAANIHLTPGETFVIDLSSADADFGLIGSATAYAGGDLFVNGGVYNDSDFTAATLGDSLAFETFMESPIPEPGTFWLLLSSGLFVLPRVVRAVVQSGGIVPLTFW
jgi:hypothetical protein